LILIAALAGLGIANSPLANLYFDTLAIKLDFFSANLALELTILKAINYVLMTIFFFVVGLEIKREISSGHLSTIKSALTPFIAAIGGMAIPALIYLLIAGDVDAKGWGVPVATDIALAVGLIALVGSSAVASLRSFLLALAVIDDIGAILIIAFVYSTGIDIYWSTFGAIIIGLILVLKKIGFKSTFIYVIFGILLWYCLYRTGVHPTFGWRNPGINDSKYLKRKLNS